VGSTILHPESYPALADPAQASRGIADYQCVIGNIAGNDRTGSDHGVPAYGVAAHDDGICSDGGSASYQRRLVFMLADDMATWVDDVREHHARPAKYVIFEHYRIVHRDIVLDFDVVADHGVADVNILAERTVGTDLGARYHVYPVPDARSRADPCA